MQFKVQINAAQCNAERLQCNTCSRLKTSVNSVHLAPRRTLFKEVLKLRVSEAARVPGPAGVCVGCRGISVSSAGKLLLQEESLRKGCVSAAGDYACRAADIKHLSAGSLPGTPVGRAVVLQKVGLDTF